MANNNSWQGNYNPAQAVVIASGATKSGVINLNGLALVGLYLPAFTGTALTFEACDTADGTFVPVKVSGGSSLSYTIAGSTFVAIDPTPFQGISFLKLVSGSAEGADRTIKCALKGL